jgi:8-amino-7-oxononanoate synthase
LDVFAKCSEIGARVIDARAVGLYPYYRALSSAQDPIVRRGNRELVMLGSNNYLGLANHPEVKEAAALALAEYGTGVAGSRLLNGTLDLHVELEDRLAQFTRRQSALVFSTGFQVNLGVLSSLLGRRDVAVLDALDHACIIDGCRLGFARTVKYRHNDMRDLARKLAQIKQGSGILIAVDGVFSMEGDIAPIPQLVDACKRYEARLFVDEAHSLGVLGKTGAGAMEHYDMKGKADLIMGTFSKSFACVGGFIAGDEAVIHYLRHHSRSLMFSAAMPPGAVATVAACLEIIKNEPERRTHLMENARYLRDGIRNLGYETGPTETPIVPVIIGSLEKTLAFWRLIMNEGIFTNAVVPPAVPPNACRLRTSCTATHTREQLDKVLEAFARVGRKLRSME